MESQQQPRILVVDDDLTTRTLVCNVLRSMSYKYEIAVDGTSGLALATDQEFDVVLVDLVMPGLDGHQLLKALRSQNPNQAIMFMSSRFDPEQVLQILRDGAFDFIQKPLKLSLLKDSLKRAISSRNEDLQEAKILIATELEESTYRFAMHELPDNNFSPPIISRLFNSGLIDLNLKLKMQVAIQEALANAIEHGNLELDSSWKEIWDQNGEDKFSTTKRARLSDPKFNKRTVMVRTKYYPGILKITIQDQGNGFKAPQGPFCPVQSQTDHLLSGRGLAIINGSFDSMSYNSQGNQITLVKALGN